MKRFNEWYDALQEPWRFLVMLTLAGPAIGLIATATLIPAILATVYLILLTYTRIHYIQSIYKNKEFTNE